MNQYEGIVEIVRGPFRVANYYLKYEYRLLAIMSSTQARKKPQPDGQFYVHRGVEYVLGRVADTPPAPMIPGKPKEATTAVAVQEGADASEPESG